jgi:hypothetical protein
VENVQKAALQEDALRISCYLNSLFSLNKIESDNSR